ncbi:MAG: Acetolactate synthase isozyme 1 large subunit [Burkholderiaceae bacterium]|nr:Acetolactate synthase isozyme 1 large subunit [Burkholderiaceae bacterium]
MLVVGSRFIDGSGQPVHTGPGSRFVYVNLEAADAGSPRQSGLALQADAAAALQALASRLAGHRASASRTDAVAQVRRWCDLQLDALQPQREYLEVLRRCLPDDGVFVNELTQIGYVANLAFPVSGPRTYLTPGYQGTLGYGFATAIGAALADPARAVISINGDGGFGWNLQELATVARYRPRLATIVFEDGAFGNVRRIQATLFKREIGSDLHNPDFVALARAFGLKATAVDSPPGLQTALRDALDGGAPALIVVRVGAMPSPWHLIHKFYKAPHPVPPNPLGEPQP